MGIKRDASDRWFSDAVRLSKNHTCEHCGDRSRQQHLAHIYGRANKSTRWSTANALDLCSYCHRTFTENPADFMHWLDGYMGEGHMEMLRGKRNLILKTNLKLRAEIAKHYRSEFKRMESTGDRDLLSWN